MHAYRKDYPRPQLVRQNWELLNGSWEFEFDDEDKGIREGWFSGEEKFGRSIVVPYTYETKMSGIGDEKAHSVVWYQKTVNIDFEANKSNRLQLHFEGVDYRADLWVNGEYVGQHTGGYARFSFDITDHLKDGSNVLTLRVADTYDDGQPRGKQRWISENFGCWYVQTTGIWKSVWMEYTAPEYIGRLKITPDQPGARVIIEADIVCKRETSDLELSALVTFEGKEINMASTKCAANKARLVIELNRPDLFDWGVHEWSMENPALYDLTLELKRGEEVRDQVESYFGLREIRIDNANILLNGRPIYQRLILDQGYWKDSHLTPPDENALVKDIEAIMSMGYNGVRKHQKTEDERFLYWCDVKGLLVWSEMAAAYEFGDNEVAEFTREWMEIVEQNYSHPSIITWTPFNESWGVRHIRTDRQQQHFTEAIYHLTKAFDHMRPVIVNDGWEHTISDILTLHDYEEKGEVLFDRYAGRWEEILENKVFHCGHHPAFAEGYGYKGQPVIISEFGGIAFDKGQGWGYGNKVKDEESFIQRFDDITTAIKELPMVCGYCYTQVSDVQQEVNGLMDMERNFKIEPSILKEINERVVE
ncbi:glycoside hydrolase family 2 protein [Butyrivibrio sp. MC2013]|uniref:glycoside hydrolase family 2 protein n=1 Tax=Butyrivibrio sp. MC2013 TaxID=1280686 RepID=UPI000414DF4E|nr:glycoside hydrolase family 2 [Butyrivibrio sp. MC2013]